MNNLVKLVSILLALTILHSCATNFEEEKKSLLTKTEDKDLLSSFDIEKENAKKFNHTEIAEDKNESEAKEKIDVVDTKKSKFSKK